MILSRLTQDKDQPRISLPPSFKSKSSLKELKQQVMRSLTRRSFKERKLVASVKDENELNFQAKEQIEVLFLMELRDMPQTVLVGFSD